MNEWRGVAHSQSYGWHHTCYFHIVRRKNATVHLYRWTYSAGNQWLVWFDWTTWLSVVKKLKSLLMTSTQQHLPESLTSWHHQQKHNFVSLPEWRDTWEMLKFLILLASGVRSDTLDACVFYLCHPNSCVGPSACWGCWSVTAVARRERLSFPPEQLRLWGMFVWQTVCRKNVQCHVNMMRLSPRLKSPELGKQIQPPDTGFEDIRPCFGSLLPHICLELQRL